MLDNYYELIKRNKQRNICSDVGLAQLLEGLMHKFMYFSTRLCSNGASNSETRLGNNRNSDIRMI